MAPVALGAACQALRPAAESAVCLFLFVSAFVIVIVIVLLYLSLYSDLASAVARSEALSPRGRLSEAGGA